MLRQTHDLQSRHIRLPVPEMLLKEGKGIRAALEDVEKRLVMQTLTDCQGNISRTAKILGIPRRTLRRKIEKYQI